MIQRRPAVTWAAGLALAGIATLVMARARPDIQQAHVVLVYLLLVLGAGAVGGRALAFTLAAFGFAAIDYWFQLPYGTVTVDKPLDWVVLIAFLMTAVVTTQLLARARAREEEARRRADEVAALARELEHAEALREANRLRDMLVSSVSHDFRTPLTTIRALAQDIASAADGGSVANVSAAGADGTHDPDLVVNAHVIIEQADRLAHLVDDVLELSRLRVGALSLAPAVNTADDLVGAAVRRAQGVLAQHPVETDIDWDAPALLGWFDFPHALRALGNLLENAVKYSPPGSPVSMSVRRDGAYLAIDVADRGWGVAPNEQERIFDAFYRPPGRPDSGSSGLGLAIARQLAEAQAGSVTYAPRVGGGSVFTLRLPIATEPEFDVDQGD